MTVSQWLPQALVFAFTVLIVFASGTPRKQTVDENSAVRSAFLVAAVLNALLWWGGFYSAFSG